MKIHKYLTLPGKIIRNRLGLANRPSFATYLVTRRCNYRCMMCDCWKRKDWQNDLTPGEVETIFRQIKKLDAIRISGGEPFLREDLPEIIDIINKCASPDIIHITSNGSLTDRMVRFVEKVPFPEKIHIKISIDAVGEKHDAIRQVPGAFNRAVRSIRAIKAADKSGKILIGINQTIVDMDSYRDFFELKKVVSDLGAVIFPDIAYQIPPMYKEDNELCELPTDKTSFMIYGTYSREELGGILKTFHAYAETIADPVERIIKEYFLRGVENRLIHGERRPSPRCVALNDHLRILPDGSVPVCLYDTRIAGSLKETPLDELWFHSERKHRLRENVRRCPGCWAECEIALSGIYTGDIVWDLLRAGLSAKKTKTGNQSVR